MKVTVESKKGLKTNLKVFVDKKTIQEKISERLTELSKTVNLKGFRPGKVPVDVLKRQFGKAVYGEVLEKILRNTSAKAIEEKKIKVAGQPKLDLKSHGEDKDLNYTLEIDELPSINLKPLKDIKFTDYEIETTNKETEDRIKNIAKDQNNFKDKNENEDAKIDDLVVFDYEATIDNKPFEGSKGKNTQLILGKDLFIKGFDNQLIGVKKKQEKEVQVIMPENYPQKAFANKKAFFKCKILNIKKPEPTVINNEFAKSLGAKDLNELKELIKKQIQNQYKMSLDAISKESILNQLEKNHEINLPDNLIQQELAIMTQNLKKEDAEKNKNKNQKIAKKRIKLGLLLNEFGEKNNLKVSEEELKNEIQKQVQSMPDQQNQVLEFYQKNPSAAASLRGTIYEDKIIKLIKEKSQRVTKKIFTKEADQLIKENQKIHDHDHSHDHSHNHNHSHDQSDNKESEKAKKSAKSSNKKKKIRKK